MSISLQLVPANENKAARARAATIEQRLSQFRAEVRPRVRAVARVHPWVADLAVSFPALLVALAIPRKGVDIASGLGLALDGAPLATIAARVRTPLWLRGFPPEAFSAALPRLPDDSEFRLRIANHFPRHWALAQRWLNAVALAYDVADAEIALWFAREAPLTVKRSRTLRRAPRLQRDMRLIALLAWFSRRGDTLIATPWNAEMQWRTALDAALTWREQAILRFYMNEAVAADPWFDPGAVDGYDFIPLRTVEDVEAEASAMRNCVRRYGPDLASNIFRLWSVRQGGERVATLALSGTNGLLPGIHELSGPANAKADKAIWIAAHKWCSAQDVHAFDAKQFAYQRDVLNQRAWRAFWRRYWLAKRRLPAWLPLNGSEDALYAL